MALVNVKLPETISITYPATGETIVYKTVELPDASIAFVFSYGLQQYGSDGAATDTHEKEEYVNDKGKTAIRFKLDKDGNKIPRDPKVVQAEKIAGVGNRVEAIETGEFSSGGGGKSLTPLETQRRAVSKTHFMSNGMKAVDADKASKNLFNALVKQCEGNEKSAQMIFDILTETAQENVDKAAKLEAKIADKIAASLEGLETA